jgi:hypothetical protein
MKIELVSSSLHKKKKQNIGVINCDTFTKKKSFCSESFIKKN